MPIPNPNKTCSLILTIHNKDFLVPTSLEKIRKHTRGSYELIVVLDGCSDNSENFVLEFRRNNPALSIKVEYAGDVFETRANNIGLKRAEGDFVIIIQDDMIVNEDDWNGRLIRPFAAFDDVFAVSANCAHNWVFNPDSRHLHLKENLRDCWSDIIDHVDHAGKHWGLARDVFAVRQCANRGPLAIDHADLVAMDYFDEVFAPLCMDDHDLCFRAKKKLGKVVGCHWIDFISDFSWGGTHGPTGHKDWFYEANHKNTRIVWERHADVIPSTRTIDDRKL